MDHSCTLLLELLFSYPHCLECG